MFKKKADLENMLLEAAGRTSNNSVKKRKTLRKSSSKDEGSYSDGGTESKDEDSNDKADDSANKPSLVPIKKRLDPTKILPQQNDNDNDEGEASHHDDGGESSNESDVGSDLYKDEDDKERLAKMTELEREMILSDRAAKKGDKEFKEQLRLKKKDNSKSAKSSRSETTPSSVKVRSSTRYAERSASKLDALIELRAKRMKHQNINAHDETTKSKGLRTRSQGKRKLAAQASSSGSSQSENMSDRELSDPYDAAYSDEDDKSMVESEAPTFEDILEITLRRSKLAKWLNEPFFDELVVGCFVRIGIGKSNYGPVYRLCMIQSIDDSLPDERQYKVENRVTHKRLVCVWGSDKSAAKFEMSAVSDSAPLEKEYNQLMREIERTSSQMASKEDVEEKREAIRKTNSYIYSAATVKQMLEERKGKPLNIAVEKDRLKNQLEIAKSEHNEEEAGRILTRLHELESTRQARANDVKARRLDEMNKKNKMENFKNLSQLKQARESLKTRDGYDPFSRRWARYKNYFSGENEESTGAREGKEQRDMIEACETPRKVGVNATEAALRAAAEAGRLIDTVAPVDHTTEVNMLHDFELPISLAELHKCGGPQGFKDVFMERKQKVEAIVGCKVPENDGRKHVSTLSISDYKRRRGLL